MADIIAKTTNLSPPPPQETIPLTRRPAYRPVSADERFLHRMTSELDTILHSPPSLSNSSSTKIPKENSVTSLSSLPPYDEGGDYNSSNDDLLISGSLADIPVQASPLNQRKTHRETNSSSSLIGFLNNSNSHHHRRNSSQDWQLSQEDEEGRPIIEWFPEADDSRSFNYSLPASVSNKSDRPFSSSMSHSGELSTSYSNNNRIQTPPTCNSPNKFTRKVKATLKILTGSSSSSHRKLTKTSSLGTTQARSTSALDRLKVSNSIISQRSKSTDLGRIKIKDLSLEALTKVNSAENVHSTSPGQCKEAPPPMISYTRPSLSQLHYTVQLPSSSSQQQQQNKNDSPEELTFINSISQQLSQERNLSGESNEASRGRSGGGGRSYRSQRERLHQTRSRHSITEESLSNSSSLIISPATFGPSSKKSPSHATSNVKGSKTTERRHYRASRVESYDDHRNSGFSSSQEHNITKTNEYDRQMRNHARSSPRPSSNKQSLIRSQSLSGGSSQEVTPRHTHATSVDLSATGTVLQLESKQQEGSGGGGGKIPARRVLSAKPLTSTGSSSTGGVSGDGVIRNGIGGGKKGNEHRGKFNVSYNYMYIRFECTCMFAFWCDFQMYMHIFCLIS